MKLLDKKIILTEYILFLIFLFPILFISIIYNKYYYLNTYIYGFFVSVLLDIILFWMCDSIIYYKLKSIKCNYKKRYKWIGFFYFISRMIFYGMAFSIVVLFPQYFNIIVFFIPLSLKTISSFWVGYNHDLKIKEVNTLKETV